MSHQRLIITDISRLVGAISYVGDFFMSQRDQIIHGSYGSGGSVTYNFVIIKIGWISVDSHKKAILIFQKGDQFCRTFSQENQTVGRRLRGREGGEGMLSSGNVRKGQEFSKMAISFNDIKPPKNVKTFSEFELF